MQLCAWGCTEFRLRWVKRATRMRLLLLQKVSSAGRGRGSGLLQLCAWGSTELRLRWVKHAACMRLLLQKVSSGRGGRGSLLLQLCVWSGTVVGAHKGLTLRGVVALLLLCFAAL